MRRKSWKEEWLFVSSAFKRYKEIGMILPSPRGLAEGLASRLPIDKMSKIVEIGSGTGRLTGAIQSRMSPQAKLVCVEINPDFCTYLRNTFPHTNVAVLNTPAEDLLERHPEIAAPPADCVVLSLPASMVPADLRCSWLTLAHTLLRDGGYLAIHQVLPTFGRHMKNGWVVQDRQWFLGFPPYRVDVYRKSSAHHANGNGAEPATRLYEEKSAR